MKKSIPKFGNFVFFGYPHKLWYPLGGTLFHFSKELGLNSSSKLFGSRIKSTRVSGFVLIRLGARVMKILVRDFTKSGPPPSTGYY